MYRSARECSVLLGRVHSTAFPSPFAIHHCPTRYSRTD